MENVSISTQPSSFGEPDVKNTIECEVLIVGGGPSGLAACLQASELGLHTVLIEAKDSFSGNGSETEGVFAVGSFLQQETGIDIAMHKIVEHECKLFNYTVDALLWADMVKASADNIGWLHKHGVGFSGIVDDYKGDGEFKTFHWFRLRTPDNRGDGSLLTQPLLTAIQKLGATMIPNVRGMELIVDEGTVKGVYAVNTKTGDVTKFNCRAVILATGGYVDNIGMMTERGFDMEHMAHRGKPGHNGDGLRMAVFAGAEDVSGRRTVMQKLHIHPLYMYSLTTDYIHLKGYSMWVNSNGERYANETCGEKLKSFYTNAKMTQDRTYSLFDSALIEKYRITAPDIDADLKKLLDGPYHNCFKADRLEELAVQAGIDPQTLRSTVERYNSMCHKGTDEDFAKYPEKMVAIETPPYYLVRQDTAALTSIGAVRTNRKFEAQKPGGKPIPGLYVIGVDGCELYRDSYSMSVPGSCNAHSIYSGRTAANNALIFCRDNGYKNGDGNFA